MESDFDPLIKPRLSLCPPPPPGTLGGPLRIPLSALLRTPLAHPVFPMIAHHNNLNLPCKAFPMGGAVFMIVYHHPWNSPKAATTGASFSEQSITSSTPDSSPNEPRRGHICNVQDPLD